MAKLIKAPNDYDIRIGPQKHIMSVFLAGSIDMGEAVNWQEEVWQALRLFPYLQVLNPRRDDWDSSWEQNINNEQFAYQVRWELDAMEDADIIFFNFSEGSKAPITLAEFGLWVGRTEKEMVVCCPEGFYRKGNVDIMYESYRSVTPFTTLESAITKLITKIMAFQDENSFPR